MALAKFTLPLRITLFFTAVTGLSACGGGGGGSPPPPPPPPPPNQAPSANAGADQAVVEGNTVTIDASASTDDRGIASYVWTQTSGTGVILNNPGTARATFDPPLTDAAYELEFEVTVTDTDGETDTATTLVTINPSAPPTVAAGADRETVETLEVTLAATIADTDGTIASIAWQQVGGPTVTLSDTSIASPTFTAPAVSTLTDFEFEVTATDSTNDAAADRVVVSVNPNEPPAAKIDFPCAGCRFYGDAILVAGVGDSGPDNAFVAALDGVTSVTVDAGAGSFDALVQTDGRWLAQNVAIPSSSEELTITITATDSFGESVSVEQTMAYQPTLAQVFLATDPVEPGRYYLFDKGNSADRLLAFDTATGLFETIWEANELADRITGANRIFYDPTEARILVSTFGSGVLAISIDEGTVEDVATSGRGTGPVPRAWPVTLDANNARLIVFDHPSFSLYSIDIASGDRTLIVDNSTPSSGEAFVNPTALTVDSDNATAYLIELTDDYMSIDLATGFRTFIPRIGDGHPTARHTEFDATRSTIYTLSKFDRVFAIDPATGVRSEFSPPPADESLRLDLSTGLVIDKVQDKLLIADFGDGFQQDDSDQILEVNRQTGQRTRVFKDTLGDGPKVGWGRIASDFPGNTVYVGSLVDSTLYSVDLSTGSRRLVSGNGIGAGPVVQSLRSVKYDATGSRLIATDFATRQLFAIDPATGNRSILSGGAVGTGDAFVEIRAMGVHPDGSTAYVVDNGTDTIVAINLSNGERTVLSPASASGIQFIETTDLVVDVAGNRLLVAEINAGGSIVAVDIGSGERSTVSSSSVGTGPSPGSMRGIDLLDQDAALVSNGSDGILRVDLSSGDRTYVAAPSIGSGEFMAGENPNFDIETQTIYRWDGNRNALFATSAITGDRVVRTK